MKLTSTTTRADLKHPIKSNPKKLSDKELKNAKPFDSKIKHHSKKAPITAHAKMHQKTIKIDKDPYFSNVSQAFLKRCSIAGGWVQQGFEKVFTLTFFPKHGKEIKKESTLATESKNVLKKKSRSYSKTKSKKLTKTSQKKRDLIPPSVKNDPKIFSKKV